MRIKTLKFIFIAILFTLAACTNKGQKEKKQDKISTFLKNFQTLKLPVISSDLKKARLIENEYLGILTDTTGRFSDNYPDRKFRFDTEYYYVGQILSKAKNFKILIIAEIPSSEIFNDENTPTLDYKIYILSLEGKIISSAHFCYYNYITNKERDEKSFIGSDLKINIERASEQKSFQIEQNGEIKFIATKKKEITGTYTDSRNGHVYKTLKIGNQIWMIENFAYKPQTGKYGDLDGNYWAYDNKDANIKNYGYLYDWETAQTIAPKGWHLPTKEEFETLLQHYGQNPFESITQGKENFNIVYSGWFYDKSGFVREGDAVGFWTSSKNDTQNAWICIIEREWKRTFIRTRFMRGTGAAVRLIKNAADYKPQTANTDSL